MTQKTLIAYSTRRGSTAEVAQSIAQTLTAQGAVVDILPLQDVKNLQAYRAVILGSAIRMGSWLPEAVKFVTQNQAFLAGIPTAFFAVHLMNLGADETSQQARLAYLDPVRKLVAPRKEAFFAGVGNWQKAPLFEKMIGKMVKAPQGDFRDPQAIRAWAEELAQAGFAGA